MGLDVDPRALRLAKGYLRDQGVDQRAEIRLQDVAELVETSSYDLAWLPLPALSSGATEAALPRLRAALHPGGYLLAATALPADTEGTGEDLHTAVLRWRLRREGVTSWGPEMLRDRLREHGFEDVRSVGSPSGTVELLVARTPAHTAPID